MGALIVAVANEPVPGFESDDIAYRAKRRSDLIVGPLLKAGDHAHRCYLDVKMSLVGGQMITGIDHVQVTIPHGREQAARQFYGDLLGMTETRNRIEFQQL